MFPHQVEAKKHIGQPPDLPAASPTSTWNVDNESDTGVFWACEDYEADLLDNTGQEPIEVPLEELLFPNRPPKRGFRHWGFQHTFNNCRVAATVYNACTSCKGGSAVYTNISELSMCTLLEHHKLSRRLQIYIYIYIYIYIFFFNIYIYIYIPTYVSILADV